MDLTGKTISAYVIWKLMEKLEQLDENESVTFKTDNYQAIQADLTAWSRMTGIKVDLIDSDKETLSFQIVKTSKLNVKEKSYAIIISDKGLEELISPLGFSLSAAFSGYQVNIYFQGPAVKVLEKGFSEKLKGLNKIFSKFARDGLAKAGHSPVQDKLRILEKYGARFYVCQASMDHFKLKQENIAYSNTTICEYFTFMEVMEKSEIKLFV